MEKFAQRVENKEFQVISKGTKFIMRSRINTNFKEVNKHAETFNSWVGREGVLYGDIYLTKYPVIEETKEDTEDNTLKIYLYSKTTAYLNLMLKFSDDDTLRSSKIKTVEQLENILRIETMNTIYELEILE